MDLDTLQRELADDGNWAVRSTRVRELGERAATWSTEVTSAVVALSDRAFEGTPEAVHSLEMAQRAAVEALEHRARFDPRALEALVRRAGRADRVSAAAFEAVTRLADEGHVDASAATCAASVLRVADRPRSNEPGGEGPLAPLWRAALDLLARVAVPDEDTATLLAEVLDRREVAHEVAPMHRSTEAVRSAALEVVAARFGVAAPAGLRTRVRALVERTDAAPVAGSAVLVTSELLRARAAVALVRIATSEEERSVAVARLAECADQRWTGVVLDVVPGLRFFAPSERARLASTMAADARCLPALVEALADAPPASLVVHVLGLAASKKAPERELFAQVCGASIRRGQLDALDALLALVADASKKVRREALRALDDAWGRAPGVIAHRWDALVLALERASEDAEIDVKRTARRLARALPKTPPARSELPAASRMEDAPSASTLDAATPARSIAATQARSADAESGSTPAAVSEGELLATLADPSAAPSARLDAITALGRPDASEACVAALAEMLARAPIEPSSDRFGPRLAEALTCAAKTSLAARRALLARAGRLDFASIPAASRLPALVASDAPSAREREALRAHVEGVLDARPAPSDAGGRFDLVLAAAANLLRALGGDASTRALAPKAARWLAHDPTPTLPFDTVTPAILDALAALGPLDAESVATLLAVAKGGHGLARRVAARSRADALAVLVLADAIADETLLELVDVLRARADASDVLGTRLIEAIPRVKDASTRELAAARCAGTGVGPTSTACAAFARARREGLEVDASFLLPHVAAFAESRKIPERIDAVGMLSSLARAGVADADAWLARLAKDRSAKVRERAELARGA